MTMDHMVKYLENRGFDAKKTYDRGEKCYDFGHFIKRCDFSHIPDAYIRYCEEDVKATRNLYYGLSLTIKNVIFNPPATIVFWMDGTKTVVKCQPGDKYDPEKGLAMAISKKALGNQGNYYNTFAKWIPEEYSDEDIIYPSIPVDVSECFKNGAESFRRFADSLRDLKLNKVKGEQRDD